MKPGRAPPTPAHTHGLGATAPAPPDTTSAASDVSAAAIHALTRRDDDFYQELSRTSNDLANLQRECERKNMELADAQTALRREKTELRLLLDLVPAMIWFKDTVNGIRRVNKKVAEAAGLPIEAIEGKATVDIYPEQAAAFHADDLDVIRSKRPKLGIVESIRNQDGQNIWVQTDKIPYCNETGQVVGIVVMAHDITERKRIEQELVQTHRQLLETSRLGGMAEVATNVLHNVGNALNSVNVSASLMVESIKTSRAASMAKVVALLREHKADLGNYITSDSKGQHIPAFLEQISGAWLQQEQTLIKELELLRDNIDHIKGVVAMQEGYAKVSGTAVLVNVRELADDSLRLNEASLVEHHVRIIREFEDVPAITVEKSKVLQILANLIRNAIAACDGVERENRCITLCIAKADDHIRISVADNGIGIAPENLTRIFSQGFTTRKDGRGIGLHNASLAASAIGGSLSAHTDGPGKGATFTLQLPQKPPREMK